MLEVLIDALLDSLKVFAFSLVIYIILSFLEYKVAQILKKESKLSPLFAALLGIIPQCGLSVVASDLYIKRHITMGSLIALFIACSDEALPIFLSSGKKAINLLPILLIKIIVGFLTGFIVDVFYLKNKHEVEEHIEHCHHHIEEEIHIGCCHHEIDDEEESNLKKHLLHPLLHSLKIFAYIIIINLIFGLIIYYVGTDKLIEVLQANKYISPILATAIGIIPNCAASVVISEVFLLDGISLGACLSGLMMNAGLGLVFLFKKKERTRSAFIILGVMLFVSILSGYITCFILGF